MLILSPGFKKKCQQNLYFYFGRKDIVFIYLSKSFFPPSLSDLLLYFGLLLLHTLRMNRFRHPWGNKYFKSGHLSSFSTQCSCLTLCQYPGVRNTSNTVYDYGCPWSSCIYVFVHLCIIHVVTLERSPLYMFRLPKYIKVCNALLQYLWRNPRVCPLSNSWGFQLTVNVTFP